jgi:formylglycine-generating enzyme required for sulfatase activity
VALPYGVLLVGAAFTYSKHQPGPANASTVTQLVPPGTEDREGQIAVDLGDGVKLKMVLIRAGEFLMGSPESDKGAPREEKPQHRVRITKPFYLGTYPVTQEQWKALMGNNPSHFKGSKNPIENVSWDDCQEFLERLNRKLSAGEGRYRLPTEAEWEYACRAGSTTRYCFGDDESGLDEYAWYDGNSGKTTHPVGEKKPNAWGLYDMHGNVREWCQDWYFWAYYAGSPMVDPMGPATTSPWRVVRSGCWDGDDTLCRSAHREAGLPDNRRDCVGVRVCYGVFVKGRLP